MVTRTEWYNRVNAEWPSSVPPLTAVEAEKAGKKLYRFIFGKSYNGEVKFTSGSHRTSYRHRVITINVENGWKGMVHSLSHWFMYYKVGNSKHGGEHARMEIRMIKEVKRRGWLDGALKTPEKAVVAVPVQDAKAAERELKRQRIAKRIEVWEKKQKRAENALKKLRRQAKYYDRPAPQRPPRTTYA
jgi:hypothetical protein